MLHPQAPLGYYKTCQLCAGQWPSSMWATVNCWISSIILVDIPVLSAKDISYQLWGFAVLGYPLQSQVLAAYWVGKMSA